MDFYARAVASVLISLALLFLAYSVITKERKDEP